MTEYSLKLVSFSNHSKEITSLILQSSLMRKLIFPAYLLSRFSDAVLLDSVDQINLQDISKDIEDDLSWILLLEGVNGLILKIDIHKLSGKELVFPHVLSIRLNDLHFQSTDGFSFHTIKALFEELIYLFRPYSGGLYQKSISSALRKDNLRHIFSTLIDGKPYQFELGWISYCGPELLDFAGQERFENLENCLESYRIGDGMMLILQEEPYVDANPDHRQRFGALINELRFKELRH